MNIEAIKNRLQAYYATVTPEQIVAEMEALGVELETFPDEVEEVNFGSSEDVPAMFNTMPHDWMQAFFLPPAVEISELSSLGQCDSPYQAVFPQNYTTEAGNYQYAMAA